MSRMTQTEIINHLADKTGIKKTEAKEFFTALAGLAAGEVKTNGEFTLRALENWLKLPVRSAKDAILQPVRLSKFLPKQLLNSKSAKQ